MSTVDSKPRPDRLKALSLEEQRELLNRAKAAKLKRNAVQETRSIEKASRADVLPVSLAQQRLWFLTQLDSDIEALHVSGAVRMKGGLDTPALEKALQAIVARHESLRTHFLQVQGVPCQIIDEDLAGFAMQRVEIGQAIDVDATLNAFICKQMAIPFDLEHGPLVRACLVRVDVEDHVLLVIMHHIIADGWSVSLLLSELSALYSAYRQGEADPLPELAIQYADYAQWQR
ncbi:condensation domain-containing protein, partial [Denitromonas iodatirespirans]